MEFERNGTSYHAWLRIKNQKTKMNTYVKNSKAQDSILIGQP